jgi:hypothetical protein
MTSHVPLPQLPFIISGYDSAQHILGKNTLGLDKHERKGRLL